MKKQFKPKTKEELHKLVEDESIIDNLKHTFL